MKIAFSKALRKTGRQNATASALWERHYRHYPVDNDDHYTMLVDYLHNDAMRHGHCTQAHDWPWSSLHRFISAGHAMPAPALIVPPWMTR